MKRFLFALVAAACLAAAPMALADTDTSVCSMPMALDAPVCSVDSAKDTSSLLNSFTVEAVVGGHKFRGVQARYKFFGIRAGRMDLSNFLEISVLTDDPLDLFNLTSENQCTEVCHRDKTLCIADQGVLNGHMSHGDILGQCEGISPDPDSDPDPVSLGFKRVDDTAETFETFIYIDTFFKGQRDCRDKDNDRPLCRLSLYIGAGAVRIKEIQLLRRNGVIRSGGSNYTIEPTATIGTSYILKNRLVVGMGYHTEAGVLVHIGYGMSW